MVFRMGMLKRTSNKNHCIRALIVALASLVHQSYFAILLWKGFLTWNQNLVFLQEIKLGFFFSDIKKPPFGFPVPKPMKGFHQQVNFIPTESKQVFKMQDKDSGKDHDKH